MEKLEYKTIKVKDLTFRLVLIPKGSFMMGSNKNEREKPIHQVSLPAFWMAEYLCTQALYEAVMEGENPSYFKGKNRPVEMVSWDDIKEKFLPKLYQLTGEKFRLPSETEWEYAAKANTNDEYAGANDLHEVGWFDENSHRETKPVGMKKPNDFWLYDMSGNVWEWCEDDWHDSYKNAPSNGSAWIDKPRGSFRMLRGGGWSFNAEYCRTADRYNYDTRSRSDSIGFRLVLPQFGG